MCSQEEVQEVAHAELRDYKKRDEKMTLELINSQMNNVF